MVQVVLVDDSGEIRSVCREVLEAGDHRIFGEAASLDGAMEIVWRCIREDVIPVLVIDGAFPKEDGGPSVQGQGRKLAEFIRKAIPRARIIACSTNRQNWGDVNLLKEPANLLKLPEIVSSLISAHV